METVQCFFSLSKNPDYAAARTGFFVCFNPKIRNAWTDKEALHFHFASFPFMPALHRLWTLVSGGQHPVIVKNLLADMGRVVGGIGYNRFNFREASVTLSYTSSKAALSWTLPGVTTVSRTKPFSSQAVWAS